MTMRSAGLMLLTVLSLAACIPYTVGQTAATLERGTMRSMQSTYMIPQGLELRDDSGSRYAPRVGSDLEFRYGLNGGKDVGVRIPGASGLVVNLKKELTRDKSRIWTAYTIGGGVVNGGEHLYGEFMYHVSASEIWPRDITPYGALRVSQVIPVTPEGVSDTPTIGVVFGAKIGEARFEFAPELGVFYDKSALDLTSRRIIVVPSVSIVRVR